MLKDLLEIRLLSLGLQVSGGTTLKKSSNSKKFGFVVIIIYGAVMFMKMLYSVFSLVAEQFYNNEMKWMYFVCYAIAAFSLMFIGSVFAAKSQLFEAKDNELLFSLPIKSSYILGSRIALLLFLNFILELLVAIPVIYVGSQYSNLTFIECISFILTSVALMLFATAISCFIGWIIALVAGKTHNKAIVTTIFSIVFLGAYFYVISQANTYIQMAAENSIQIANSLGSILPLYVIGKAISGADFTYLFYVIIIGVIVFGIAYCSLSKSINYIVFSESKASKIKYRERELKVSKVTSALFSREMKRFVSSSTYMVNSGLGVIFAIAFAVVLIVMKTTFLNYINIFGGGKEIVVCAIILILGFILITAPFTAPSISLEGKSLWILKSLPISISDIFKSKLKLHLYLTIPPIVIVSAVSIYLFELSIIYGLFLVVIPILFTVISANIGLICNLNHPKLDWINEVQVIKQGMSIFTAMIYNFIIIVASCGVILALLVIFPQYFILILSLYTVILILVCVITYKRLITKGIKQFESL